MSNENAQLVPADQCSGLSAEAAQLLPFAHYNDYIKLPVAERERVKELLEVMSSVKSDDRGVVHALKTIGLQNKGRRGWSFANLRTLFYAWLDTGDWRVLARNYGNETSLPAEFVAHLRTLCLKEHRSRKQAIHRIREAWRAGGSVPGYGTWREWFATQWPDRDVPKHFAGDYPAGWSTSNLYLHMPSKAQHTLATKGRAAAQKFLPSLERDPSELRFLELITIDDFETDILVVHGREVVRVRGLLAIDVATRTRLAVGFKPRIENEEGRKISITRADMQFLLKSIFARWGVPAEHPMTLLVENAAAAISAELEAALDLHFGGQVRVDRTGMLNYKTLANGFVERGGKPAEKGWIESAFNLFHNRYGNLPGQKGSRYDNAPGDLDGRVKYFKQLAGYESTDEQWAAFRKPFYTFDEAVTAFETAFDWMDQRTDHKMIGFAPVHEWRLGPGDAPKPMDDLALVPVAEQTKVEILPARMESPIERRARLVQGCKFFRVPEPVLALLAFSAKRVDVKNHRVTFTLRKQGYTFGQSGSEIGRAYNNKEVVAYFDERTMAAVYCFTLDGAYLGALPQVGGRADIKDPDAISAAAEQIRQFIADEVEKPVRHLLAAERAQADADRAHNEQLAVQWKLKGGDDEQKRKGISHTLAQDNYVAPAEGRFAAGMKSAAGIAAGATEQAEDARRKKVRRTTTKDLSALAEQPACESTAAEPDLSRLL